MAKITKVKDDAFNGNHPNGINAGYTKEINETPELPIVGACYYFGSLRTSIVESFKETEKGYEIKTMNSVYEVER